MRRLGLIATIPVAAMLFAGSVHAQDATPSPDDMGNARSINAKMCSGDPVTADALIAAAGAQPAESGFKLQIPLGEPATGATKAAIADTVRGFLSCLNANDPLRAANFLTAGGQRFIYGGNVATADAANAFKTALGTEPTARKAENAIRLYAITDINDAGGGYYATMVTFSDPTVPPRGAQTLLVVLKDENGTPKIDSFVAFSKAMAPAGTPEASPAASS